MLSFNWLKPNIWKEQLRAKSKMVATAASIAPAAARLPVNEDVVEKLRLRDEHIAKLNAEVSALQEMAESARKLRAMNANLQGEIERLQAEISAQPSSARTSHQPSNLVQELERTRSELDVRRAEVKRLQEELRNAKAEMTTLKTKADESNSLSRAMETTISDLRVSLATEKGKSSAHDRATAQDAARIRDLDRQVKELEGIVMRQNRHQASSVLPGPNPASAAANRERVLQAKIDQLEAELLERHSGVSRLQTQLASVKTKYEELIANLEQKLSSTKEEIAEFKEIVAQTQKETAVIATQTTAEWISDRGACCGGSELQVSTQEAESLCREAEPVSRDVESVSGKVEVVSRDAEPVSRDAESEAAPKGRRRTRGTAKRRSASVGAGDAKRATSKAPVRRASASMDGRTSTTSSRQDIHLICTIRGLQQEVSARDRDVQRLQRELSDVRATNRRLQQERERLLKQDASSAISSAAASINPRTRQTKKDASGSEAQIPKADVGVQVMEFTERSFDPSNASYDPMQFDAESSQLVEDLQRENRGLREDVVRLQEDLLGLHAKRASDINRLQSKHDDEIQRLLERHSGPRTGAARVADLQGQLYTQQLVITHLKEQLKQLEKTAKEVALLKKERDHLEETVLDMTKKISRLRDMHTPDTLKYAALQDKVDELEARHECRERKLQAIIRDLQQQFSSVSCGGSGPSCSLSGSSTAEACPSATRLLQKNRDLCLYRAELDRLLTALRQLDALRKSSHAE